jgi:hypothetical protein
MLGALAPLCAAAFLGLAGSAAAYTPSGVTSNGFETNTAGWSNNDGTITQRASGYVNPGGYASGIAAAEGSHFAGLDRGPCSPVTDNPAGPAILCHGPYTDWGNLSIASQFKPYTTQVDIYLDTDYAKAHPDTFSETPNPDFTGNLNLATDSNYSDPSQVGTRFDFTSAINDTSGNFLRDFGFNVATGNDQDSCPGFIITGQTVVNRDNANPHLVNYNRECISAKGWYTFKHTFSDNNGFLDVLMQIFPKGSSTEVAHWDINNLDPIGNVGCNRYGYFSDQEIYGLPIDNSKITGGCAPAPQVGQILPTGTTPQQYSAGTAGVLSSLQYNTKGNLMNAVAPGVFFYYTKVSGDKGDQVGISEKNNGNAAPIPIQQGQAVLYDASTYKVVKWNPTINSDGIGTAMGSLPAKGDYILGVKYSASGLQGQKTPIPTTVTYSFGTALKGDAIPADTATIDLAPKH